MGRKKKKRRRRRRRKKNRKFMKNKRRELGINIVSGLGYARFQENWPGSILPRRGAHPARPRVSPFKRAPYVIRKEGGGRGEHA